MPTDTYLKVGYKIGNHYEILEVPDRDDNILGHGGFGIVYLVRDIHKLNKLFVVKELFLKKDSFRYRKDGLTVKTSNKKEAIETFRKVKEDIVKEVNILSSIRNRNIVQAEGYIEENNTIYSIMEYIEGTNLEEYIQHNSFDEKEAINLLRQLIYGLKEIHQQKIIHRDIKPSNIMKTQSGLYKLIDFTTSKTYSKNKETLTGFRTKGYAPPELEQTKANIGDYSDIYSIGMTLFRLLARKEPPLIMDRFTDNNSFLNDIDSLDISYKLKNIIKKMTKVEVKDRFQNLKEIEKELNREPSPPTPSSLYLQWVLIVIITIAVGYLSYYLYDMLSKQNKPIIPQPSIKSSAPLLQERSSIVKEPSLEPNPTTTKEDEIKEDVVVEPKIKLLDELEFDKNKMINHLNDRDILTLTNNYVSFSFEKNRLMFPKSNRFVSYRNKLIWKLKNPKYSVGLGLTNKLKKQQFAKKIALGVHKNGKEIHLVITPKDGYDFDSKTENGYKILTFKNNVGDN